MKSSCCQNTEIEFYGAYIKIICLHFKTSVGLFPSDAEMARDLEE